MKETACQIKESLCLIGMVQIMTNVLLIYDVFIPSVRLCGYEQMKWLEQKGKISFTCSDAKEVTSDQCSQADVVIFVRSSTWLEWKIAKRCKKADKLILYVLDDDVFEIAQDSLVTAYFHQSTVRNRVRWFIANSNVFVSPSKHILEKYKKDAKRILLLEEPCLNYNAASARKKENRKLKIGFAGSVDRTGDVQRTLQEAIEEFYKKHKEEADIEFMGAKIELIDKLGLTHYPYEEEYEQYQKRFFELNWDIGLAPMPDTEFHRGKHYNKYIEYGSIGCVGIYSNVIPYTYIVKNGENGILCGNSTKEWIEAMEWCLENPERIEKIRRNIESDMKKNFTLERIVKEFLDQIPEILTYKAGKKGKYPVVFYRKMSWMIRYVEFIIRNGKDTPKKFLEKVFPHYYSD